MTYLKNNLTEAHVSEAAEDQSQRLPAIKAVNLTKRFGERVSVDHLNLEIYPGELYSLLGDNGAGKTTTLNMLTTLLKPSEGEFYICGYHGSKDSEKIKGVFGVVSQDVAIYNELTAYENLKFLADLYGLSKETASQRIALLLARAGLAQRANDLVSTFSGGMQRKLTIAGAMLHEPQVLFMDEPTVGLDPSSRLQIWSALAELRKQGVTILLTTHYLEEAEALSDRIGIIREGKLVAEGTIDELRHKIQAIRLIAVQLAKRIEPSEIEAKLGKLAVKFAGVASLDLVHNTITFAQSPDSDLPTCMNIILAWLQAEDLPYSKLSTVEPSLEEVYLAVSSSKDTASLLEDKSRLAWTAGELE